MSLLKQWEENAYQERTQEENDAFWKPYLEKEKSIYEVLVGDKIDVLSGTVKELAEKYSISTLDFSGFLSGINSSLENPLEVETLEEDSQIDVKIDFEKLLFNMHDATAEWLYGLPQWDNVFTKEKQREIKAAYNRSKTVVNEIKIGRNDPCPCGSGKKYKKCCGSGNANNQQS